ncbi:MAG TPA: hypothetical protein VFM73_02115 [Xanthomonadaceae bacterium]|nr:hypothetical protein [Xanthomonadaceae bacterium]
MARKRPVLFVLAGVNGAGKSSVGGHLLARQRLPWFNPDTFARELKAAIGCDQRTANIAAWHEGVRRLDAAIARRLDFAIETTLGGHTMPAKIARASRTHDVLMWFCGLDSDDHHVARVRARVAAGGHDIPEAKIRERYPAALTNLIVLMPKIARLQVYDNSKDAAPGESIPDPLLVAEVVRGTLVWPRTPEELAATPDWARPVLAAAMGP